MKKMCGDCHHAGTLCMQCNGETMSLWKPNWKILEAHNETLEAENKMLKDALNFYADKNNYEVIEDSYSDLRFAITEDDEFDYINKEGFNRHVCGKLASETLKKLEQKNEIQKEACCNRSNTVTN